MKPKGSDIKRCNTITRGRIQALYCATTQMEYTFTRQSTHHIIAACDTCLGLRLQVC